MWMRLIALVLMVLFSQASISEDVKNPYSEYRIKTYKIQEAYLKNITEHQAKVMKDLESKLAQQEWQTTAITIMVIVMILFGLCLSALQFYYDFKSKGQSSINLKIGTGSFEISSSVIGLAILAISFWFFQAYIDKVYEIHTFTIQPIDVTTFGANR